MLSFYTKTDLENAADSLAIRPLLWDELTPLCAEILRKRFDGQAYTAIAQTLDGTPLSPAQIKKYEAAACRIIKRTEAYHVNFDRQGLDARYAVNVAR